MTVPARTRADWAATIAAAWNKTLDGIFEAGRALIDAKAALAHGEFMGMVAADLPFGQDTANKLMRIANDGRLLNSEHVLNLPRSWGTLYELTKLGDDEFDAALAAGKIRPDMDRTEAALLRTAERRIARLTRAEEIATRPVAPIPTRTAFAVRLDRDSLKAHDLSRRLKTPSGSGLRPDSRGVPMPLCRAAGPIQHLRGKARAWLPPRFQPPGARAGRELRSTE